MGRFDCFWEMRRGGPHEAGEQVFKCTHCGAETATADGWDGAPDLNLCQDGCAAKASDWNPGRTSAAYRQNYDRIFGNRHRGGGAKPLAAISDAARALRRFNANYNEVFGG